MENATSSQAIIHHGASLLIQRCRNIKGLVTFGKSKKGRMSPTFSSILSQKNPKIYYFYVWFFLL